MVDVGEGMTAASFSGHHVQWYRWNEVSIPCNPAAAWSGDRMQFVVNLRQVSTPD